MKNEIKKFKRPSHITFHINIVEYDGDVIKGGVMQIKLCATIKKYPGKKPILLGTLYAVEDQATGTIWIFNVTTTSGHTEEGLIMLYLSCVHNTEYYAKDILLLGAYRQDRVLAYGIVQDESEIPYGLVGGQFNGHVIYVSPVLTALAPVGSGAFSVGTKEAEVDLIIHDPIADDKLSNLLAESEKQFRAAWCAYLDKGDIEGYQKQVEMIIAQTVDKWNET